MEPVTLFSAAWYCLFFLICLSFACLRFSSAACSSLDPLPNLVCAWVTRSSACLSSSSAVLRSSLAFLRAVKGFLLLISSVSSWMVLVYSLRSSGFKLSAAVCLALSNSCFNFSRVSVETSFKFSNALMKSGSALSCSRSTAMRDFPFAAVACAMAPVSLSTSSVLPVAFALVRFFSRSEISASNSFSIASRFWV